MDGRILICLSCGSYRHLLDACPDSWEKVANRYGTRKHGLESVTGTKKGKRQISVREHKALEPDIDPKSG